VLIVYPVGPAAAAYYFQGQGAGRWVGRGAECLGMSGSVQRRQLSALLRGCDPGDRRFLPAWKPARRRSGWDLTLGAPKSLSLLGALAEGAGDAVAAAHGAAVDKTVVHFERRLLRLRRSGAPGGVVPSDGVVAAAFDHRVNASGEPHLHTHLLLMNLGRSADGTWSAIDPGWWTQRRSLAAVYQLGLRHQLAAAGLRLDWRTREDGLADLADVPRAAVRSASSRSRAAVAARAAYADPGGGRRAGIRAIATARTRISAPAQPWEARATASGFGSAEASRVAVSGRARTGLECRNSRSDGEFLDAGLGKAVTARLASQRSSFRYSDVLVALAACLPAGAEASAAAEWADRFCAAAIPLPARTGSVARWTTELARAADRHLVHEILGQDRPGAHPGAAADLLRCALDRNPTLSGEARAAVRGLLDGCGLASILAAPAGRSNLLAQSVVLEAAASAWRAAGLQVAVATSAPDGPRRWQVLTGIESRRAGSRPDVIVVDHADRRATPELLAILSDLRRATRVVLVEGGTCPRLSWMHSDGLRFLGDRLGRLDPGPVPSWTPGLEVADRATVLCRGGTGPPVAAGTGVAAACGLIARWAEEWAPDSPPVLVGLGYAEADGLNQAARGVRVRRGEIFGPALTCGGRQLQAGDRVFPLRRVARDLSGRGVLTVAEVDAARGKVTVCGEGRATTLGRTEAAHLGYGYAVTPALLGRTTGPIMVLGPPDSVGVHQSRVAGWAVAVPEPDRGHSRFLSPRTPAMVTRDRGAEMGLG
jgi:conjugative relaxase-like TrwC/TraI family protein